MEEYRRERGNPCIWAEWVHETWSFYEIVEEKSKMLVLGQFGNLEEGVYEVRGTWRGEAAVTCEAWQAQSTCLAFQLQSYTNQNWGGFKMTSTQQWSQCATWGKDSPISCWLSWYLWTIRVEEGVKSSYWWLGYCQKLETFQSHLLTTVLDKSRWGKYSTDMRCIIKK